MISLKLGAGRKSQEASIDPTAGIIFDKKVGGFVHKGERLGTLYTSTECEINELGEEFRSIFRIEPSLSGDDKKIIKKVIKGIDI